MFRSLLTAALLIVVQSVACADTITFNVSVDKAIYFAGETVNWSVSALASDFSANNFGVSVLSFDLAEDRGEFLSTATIAVPFQDYAFTNGGVAGAGSLLNVGASLFSYNAGAVELTSASPGPTLLATGSFVVNQLGLHNLSLTSEIADNFYFTANSGTSVTTYTTVMGDAVSFNVTSAAVPEPGSVLFLSALTCGAVALRKRKFPAK